MYRESPLDEETLEHKAQKLYWRLVSQASLGNPCVVSDFWLRSLGAANGDAENGARDILLGSSLHEPQEPRRPTEADNDQTGSHRVEGAGVAHLLDSQQAANLGDDVV